MGLIEYLKTVMTGEVDHRNTPYLKKREEGKKMNNVLNMILQLKG